MVDGRKKLIGFLEGLAALLYSEAKPYREKLGIVTDQADYQRFKEDIMEESLTLFKMMKSDIIDDSAVAALIYITNPQHFKAYRERGNFKNVKRNRDFLLTYFNLTSKELKSSVRSLERKIERKIGEDWVAKVYFTSKY
ncbi:MAG: hypothetical protein QMD12_02415 [Candidatus Aenigmarchaeota archaeon]|nr:hypothetical protein [Candidatus Aenigmarchaeota archaeon]